NNDTRTSSNTSSPSRMVPKWMVWVDCRDRSLPLKTRLTMAIASAPDTRMIAMAPLPAAGANATIVSCFAMAAKVQNSTDHRTARQYRPLFGDHNSVAHNVRLEIPILQVTTACNADIISNATIFINDGIFDVAILPDAGQWNSLLMGVLD